MIGDFSPAMLVLARESRRFTQKALAEASECTQGTVSKAEAGVLKPAPELVAKWAAALRYAPSFLFRLPDAPGLPMTFFRKKASLSVTSVKAIKAAIAIRCMQIETLVRSVEPPENNVRSLTIPKDVKNPAEAARYIRSVWRVPPGPIGNLTQLLEDNGVVVVPIERETTELSGLSVYEKRGTLPPVMFINAAAPGDRYRFTMAHELGHVVLHHHLLEPAADGEDEADEFASEFLMPSSDIRGHFGARVDLQTLAHMKLHWRVSMGSVLMKAKSLGRVTESQSSLLWRQMSAAGYRKNEPVDVPREAPQLVFEFVDLHIRELGFTEDELSESIGLNVEEFVDLYRPGQNRGLRLVP